MKRRFIILTAMLLSISLLAGCGQAETANSAETQTMEALTESTATQEQSAAQTPEPTEAPTPAPTEEPTPEPTVEPTEAPTPEPTAEPTPVPTEEPTPEPTEEPTPAPQITYTYTDMNVTLYATQTVNVRNLPSTDGEKVGSLSTNQEVAVTGQCNETGWYRFDYSGQTAFVSDKYLSTEMVEVAPPAQEPAQTTTQYVAGWNDMGDWFVYINSSLDSPENNVDGAFWTDKKAILQERYPGCNTAGPIGIKLADGTSTAWLVSVGGTHSYDYPQALLDFIKVNQYKY